MSTMRERSLLLAHLQALRAALEDRPSRDVVGRMSLEAQVADFEEQLVALDRASAVEPAHIELAFTGAPVTGTEGVEAGFAAKAVELFNDLVRTIRVEEAGQQLRDDGALPVPDDAGPLQITGLVRGSFGFRLQETLAQTALQFEGEANSTRRAMERTVQLVAGLLRGDEAWSEAAVHVPDRALRKLQSFLTHLKTSRAGCKLWGRGHMAELGVDAVERAVVVVSDAHLQEQAVTRTGVLAVRPRQRDFELVFDDISQDISGDIGRRFRGPELTALSALTGRRCEVELHHRVIERRNRRRESWQLQNARPTGAPSETDG